MLHDLGHKMKNFNNLTYYECFWFCEANFCIVWDEKNKSAILCTYVISRKLPSIFLTTKINCFPKHRTIILKHFIFKVLKKVSCRLSSNTKLLDANLLKINDFKSLDQNYKLETCININKYGCFLYNLKKPKTLERCSWFCNIITFDI